MLREGSWGTPNRPSQSSPRAKKSVLRAKQKTREFSGVWGESGWLDSAARALDAKARTLSLGAAMAKDREKGGVNEQTPAGHAGPTGVLWFVACFQKTEKAPPRGLEPLTRRLTAACSTN